MADPTGPLTVGRGSPYLPTSSKATSKGKRFPVNIKVPVFHGKGLVLSGTKEMTGFVYKSHGCISDPDGDEMQTMAGAPRSAAAVPSLKSLMETARGQ